MSQIAANVVNVPANDAKPKIRLMMMVPAAPISIAVFPPMRSVRRPFTNCPVPYAIDHALNIPVI